MIETLDGLISALGLSLHVSCYTHGVRTVGNIITVNPGSGNVLLLMTAVGKCLMGEAGMRPSVRIAMCSYTGWYALLGLRSEISDRLYGMLLENALVRCTLDTLTTQLMACGMATAFAVAGVPLPVSSTNCRFHVPPELNPEDVQSAMESSLPSFPEDVEDSLRTFISRL